MAFLATATDAFDRLSERGVQLRLDDRPSAVTQYARRATNTVKAYLLPIYTEANLESSASAGGMINDIATSLMVGYLGSRRGNSRSSGIQADFDEAMSLLEDAKAGVFQIPGIARRAPGFPSFSNIRLDNRYAFKKLRVETQISDETPTTGYVQAYDWFSTFFVEY